MSKKEWREHLTVAYFWQTSSACAPLKHVGTVLFALSAVAYDSWPSVAASQSRYYHDPGLAEPRTADFWTSKSNGMFFFFSNFLVVNFDSFEFLKDYTTCQHPRDSIEFITCFLWAKFFILKIQGRWLQWQSSKPHTYFSTRKIW